MLIYIYKLYVPCLEADGRVVGVVRGGAASTGLRSSGNTRPTNKKSSASAANSTFSVYVDENNDPSASSGPTTNWSDFGTQKLRNKENEGKVEKWNDVTLEVSRYEKLS